MNATPIRMVVFGEQPLAKKRDWNYERDQQGTRHGCKRLAGCRRDRKVSFRGLGGRGLKVREPRIAVVGGKLR
jgi:hypothetical protein